MRPIFLLCLLSLSLQGWTQQQSLFPDRFGTFFNSKGVLNPASVQNEYNVRVNFAYQLRTGAFSKVSSYVFNAEKNFGDGSSFHNCKLTFYNKQNGPYINNPSGYLNYAYRLGLSDNAAISAGLAFGLTGFYYSVPNVSGAGTGTYPDGSLGLTAYYKNFSVGGAFNRSLNIADTSSTRPGDFLSYYHLLFSWEKEINPEWEFSVTGYYSFYPLVQNQGDIATVFSFRNVLEVGAMFRTTGGAGFYFAVTPAIEGDHNLRLGVAYNASGISRRVFEANTVELNVAYLLK